MTLDALPCRETRAQIAQFDQLWRKKYHKFYRKALRLAQGNRDLAETLMSRTAVRVLEHMHSDNPPVRNLEAFFFVALRHASYDHWRRYHANGNKIAAFSQTVEDEGFEDTLNSMIAREEIAQVVDMLGTLPRSWAEVLCLRVFEDRDYVDIAQRMDISQAVARKRVQLARKALRNGLRPVPANDIPQVGAAQNMPVNRHSLGALASYLSKAPQSTPGETHA